MRLNITRVRYLGRAAVLLELTLEPDLTRFGFVQKLATILAAIGKEMRPTCFVSCKNGEEIDEQMTETFRDLLVDMDPVRRIAAYDPSHDWYVIIWQATGDRGCGATIPGKKVRPRRKLTPIEA